MVGFCIINDDVVEDACKKEIIRRYYNELNNYKIGLCDEDTYKNIKLLMNELKIDESYLDVIKPALDKKKKEGDIPVVAMKVGRKIFTGKQTDLLSAAGSVVLNAIKYLSKIPDDIDMLSPTILEPILDLKKNMGIGDRLNLNEVLIALSICSVTNSFAAKAIASLPKLKGCEAHATYILTGNDKQALKDLKINVTCESEFLDD